MVRFNPLFLQQLLSELLEEGTSIVYAHLRLGGYKSSLGLRTVPTNPPAHLHGSTHLLITYSRYLVGTGYFGRAFPAYRKKPPCARSTGSPAPARVQCLPPNKHIDLDICSGRSRCRSSLLRDCQRPSTASTTRLAPRNRAHDSFSRQTLRLTKHHISSAVPRDPHPLPHPLLLLYTSCTCT